MYGNKLSFKYQSVFPQLRQILLEKKADYMTYLDKELKANQKRVDQEQEVIQILSTSFKEKKDDLRK